MISSISIKYALYIIHINLFFKLNLIKYFFYGRLFPSLIKNYLCKRNNSSYIFLSKLSNPNSYGITYLKNKKLIIIIEKPKNLKSNLAVTGLYIYHRDVLYIINTIKTSKRNDLEITSVNNKLLKKNI